MAINKRKILESAQKNLQKGAIDKALEDYRTLLKADPHDSNVLLKVGDLHLKQGKRGEAINAYVRVAQQFTRDGFDAKAVALYKQISRLDPKRSDVSVPLADLYARMGLVSDAIASLQSAADAAYRAGEKDDALELLRRMAALDPSNTSNRLKVAELLAQERRTSEALAEYEAVAEELERRSEVEERIRVVERILTLDPERAPALREVARAKLATEQFAAAQKLAERLVTAHPEDLDGFEILGHALLGAGEAERSRDVFRDLAERFRQRGDEDRARDLMQRFGGLAALAPDSTDPPVAADENVLELETEAGGEEFLLEEEPEPPLLRPKTVPVAKIDPVPALKRAAPRPPEPAPIAVAPPPLVPRGTPAVDPETSDPDQLLAEATVYLRYGKHQRAVGALRAILAREPGHRPALEHLGEALLALGERAHALTAWLRAAEGATQAGDAEAFARVRARIATLDAAAAQALVGPQQAPAPPATLDDIEIDLDLDLDLEGGLESAAEPAPAAPSDGPALEVGDADGGFLFGGEPSLEDPAAWSPDDGADSAREAQAEAVARPAAAVGARADEDPTDTTPAQLAAELEEAEFYLEQGLLDEARTLYERIVAAAPNHPQAMLRLGEIAAKSGGPIPSPAPAPKPPARAPAPAVAPAPTPAPAPAPAPPPVAAPAPAVVRPRADVTEPSLVAVSSELGAPVASGDFDLAAELSLAIGTDEPAVRTLAGTEEEAFEHVFQAFKSGVERELGEDDHEARYDLGIAYKEMGLLEDAISEFRIAMLAPERKLSCLHMMGLCALELGRAQDAVAHLEQALSLPDLPSDQRVPLRYDVARAYAAHGDLARARAAFEEVRAADPAFREVERELAALSGRPPGPRRGASTEAYESFDDLLAETSDAPAAPRYESFTDLFAEGASDAPPSKASEAPAEEPAPDPEPVAEPMQVAEPEPEPVAAPAPAEEASPLPARKRRKISFV